MEYILLIIACLCAVYFLLRYLFLCRSIRSADRELQEIVNQIEENQILKLSEPNRALEALLETTNSALTAIRQQRILYDRRERNSSVRLRISAMICARRLHPFWDIWN